jgi:hypothetical protein
MEAAQGWTSEGKFAGLREDWEVIARALPEGWAEQAKALGALKRVGEFQDASRLLRTMLIHLSDGCSLRETAVRAKAGGLVSVSDVALHKRLRGCGEWFRWMGEQLTARLSGLAKQRVLGKRVRWMDSSVVCEPGATGSTWRLHDAIELSSLCCEEAHVTEISEGESLGHFAVKAGDIVMADRGLATRRGIRHGVSHGGEVWVRLNLTRVPLEDESGRPVPLLPLLRTLAVGQTGHWRAWIRDEHGVIPVRVCAVKKSQAQTRQTQYKMRKKAQKAQRRLLPNTLEAAH